MSCLIFRRLITTFQCAANSNTQRDESDRTDRSLEEEAETERTERERSGEAGARDADSKIDLGKAE